MVGLTQFQGRVAVLTGGASGIGLELLLGLARRGTHVAVCDVDARRLDAAVRRARSVEPDVRVTAHVHDVADEAAVGRLRAEVAEQHDTDAVHLLVNNAGIVGGTSFVTGPREEWDRTFAVCWSGTYHCTRAFLPMLLAADQGVVVNTSSVNGLWASLGPRSPHTAYASAKFAVRGFTEALRVDFQAHAPHLSAVLVLPGHVRTRMPSPPRTWRRALGQLFADYQPVTAPAAAETILEAVGRGDWRVVIGDDAAAVDARVRADPWTAYD
ncbi:SDR family NAD(P)-dependent oxidoreductase [Cellulomonas oligotrophica]|uniref:NAD(P)-dependent dehydrogenase (Short-subunit alcohol dehydrogenase family) n=1 Tax=Cellulomonas oligotrophica TaxID=931536 RepID=A0A7Y9FG12_9CELL|nr:SDR family oxidoreductase [Cellulomonas oligotrophica]NYD86212.1 NAD(P)-dependent dehydrogenase (short-subunit alcohol dehydrogenase family) [Cellulomonas oligotrophica]GIG34461.1 short-chain dehydrogenase [Cellulomonas oligotrophica]